ncbi:hypothetical protein BKA65DRAFT_485401 [Rhexocercosporidium sp. MPI-PUGE-AT-0058]|nr:hypothetical protein BKA65DRAFT_485401 [Rhexocercosporidium sp. MPI-PUGE-AT-0058]
MQFTTSILAVVAYAAAVNAHGHLRDPPRIKHTGAPVGITDIRVPAQGCGSGVVISGKAVATFKAGSIGNATWSVDNGDGAGPLLVAFDPTGAGTSFTAVAKMIENVDGSNGGVPNSFPRGPHDISFTVPNVKCTGCVMQVRQDLTGGKDGFGSCAVVDIV